MIEKGTFWTDGEYLYELESERVVQGQKSESGYGLGRSVPKTERYYTLRNCFTDYCVEVASEAFKKMTPVAVSQSSDLAVEALLKDLDDWEKGPPVWMS